MILISSELNSAFPHITLIKMMEQIFIFIYFCIIPREIFKKYTFVWIGIFITGCLVTRGVTRHLYHETRGDTRLGSRERDEIFRLKKKILNDEIYWGKVSFIQLKNTKCKKCRCILKSTYTL